MSTVIEPRVNAGIPPGIKENFKQVVSGGDDVDWMPFERKREYTNAFIIKDGKLLLGYKKRGFGVGMYNGFGGKVEPGESTLQAALRELEEEAGITAPLEHAGTLLFVSEGVDHAFNIEIYCANGYSGVVTETEEMRPEWFSIPSKADGIPDFSNLPFGQMWGSDPHWIPFLFSKTPFVGRADFKRDGVDFTGQKWWFGIQNDA